MDFVKILVFILCVSWGLRFCVSNKLSGGVLMLVWDSILMIIALDNVGFSDILVLP